MSRDFEQIRPLGESETLKAIQRIASSPLLPVVSGFFFPQEPLGTLRRLLKKVHSIEDFQRIVMCRIVESVVERTSSGLSFSGLENLASNRHLIVSNHRDITLDPALLQWLLLSNGMDSTEVCVGNNLLRGGRLVSDILLSNRMIMVERALAPRQLYLSSLRLSRYIRETVTSGRCSVWIAQREGRAKNGRDLTEPGLIRMFDMSGGKDLLSNFRELSIVPMSISYEYEPCGAMKARELLLSSGGTPYMKRRNEDTQSIIRGLKNWKGGIHLEVLNPLTDSELNNIVKADKKASYMALKTLLDEKTAAGYKLWKTNYMACDLLRQESRYSAYYSAADLDAFRLYTEKELRRLEPGLDRTQLRRIFWSIYANPLIAKEKLG